LTRAKGAVSTYGYTTDFNSTACSLMLANRRHWWTFKAIPAKIVVPSEDPERYYEGTTPDYKSEGYLNARLVLITNKHSPRMTATMKVGLNVLR
jgi:hypothetical protein